jgi:hypothetical protein
LVLKEQERIVAGRFPCPYCKGEYSWVEPVLDDGSGPTYTCGFCDEGMIEIGSEKHMEIKRNNPPKYVMWEMLGERGYVLDEVVRALEQFDGEWSEKDRLLDMCKKAQAFVYEPKLSD